MSEEKCKFYKKQFLSNYCELFKQPCYGKHCNFIKEFTRLNELEQELQAAKEDAERYRQEANNASELAQKNLDKYFKAKEENEYRDNMLCEQIEIWRSNCDAWMNQSNKFEQQNKQMREALENAKKMFIEQGHCPWADGTGKFDCESCNDNCMFPSIQQALNQLKGVE